MTTIADEFMRQMMSKTKNYTLVILRAGPNRNKQGADKIIWEHGRRNFSLREEGLLSVVCPVSDGSELNGIGIFNASIDKVKLLMDEDPGVKQGLYVYEVNTCKSFPGDILP